MGPTGDAPHAGRIYFPNLDGLRFIAALSVIVFHIELTKEWFGLPFLLDPVLAYKLGHLGVVLFFVLSGFLITYLLLDEQSRGQIRIGPFYLRRVLRIWPLYYAVVILSLFVLPFIPFFSWPGVPPEAVHQRLWLKVLLFVAFLPNLIVIRDFVPYAPQTWSIGVEEQFYLVWPHLISRIRHKTALMLGIVMGHMVLGALIWRVNLGPDWNEFLRGAYNHSNFDCLALGGLAAVGLYESRRWLLMLVNPGVFAVAAIISALLILSGPLLEYRLYAIPFALLVVNLAADPRMSEWLEARLFRYLGAISYGLYMWHFVAIVTALKILQSIGLLFDVLLFPLAIGFSIVLAAVSHRFLESPFLRRKDRLASAHSGPR
ncbi:MAG: acyltransferase [Vicinamibacteria bacterium]